MPVRRVCVLMLVVGSAIASGCAGASPAGDKAGGRSGSGPLVLRLANPNWSDVDIPPIAYFVSRVNQLSHGAIQIRALNQFDNYAPDAEVQVVRAVAAGRVDLGWAGSRVFDTIGVASFRALSAPMLIDNYPLERAVLASAMPAQMLSGVSRVGAAGLGLFGDALRLPISVKRALLSPADWRGVRFGTYRSRIQEDAIRALGAVPVEALGIYRSHFLATGRLQGLEMDVRRYTVDVGVQRAPYVVANLDLWPQFDVLLGNPRLLRSLSAQQRAWLSRAAADAAGRSVAMAQSTVRYLEQECASGARFVNATQADLAAMRRALAVVYRALARDPQTEAYIERIETLKRATPPGPPPMLPNDCKRG